MTNLQITDKKVTPQSAEQHATCNTTSFTSRLFLSFLSLVSSYFFWVQSMIVLTGAVCKQFVSYSVWVNVYSSGKALMIRFMSGPQMFLMLTSTHNEKRLIAAIEYSGTYPGLMSGGFGSGFVNPVFPTSQYVSSIPLP